MARSLPGSPLPKSPLPTALPERGPAPAQLNSSSRRRQGRVCMEPQCRGWGQAGNTLLMSRGKGGDKEEEWTEGEETNDKPPCLMGSTAALWGGGHRKGGLKGGSQTGQGGALTRSPGRSERKGPGRKEVETGCMQPPSLHF